MELNKLIEQFRKLNEEMDNVSLKKSSNRVIALLEQIDNKKISDEKKENIQRSISPYLESIQNQEDIKPGLKKLRRSLKEDFGFVPLHYFLAIGIGSGIAIGTSLGISLGVPFDRGIIFGPMIGSGLGMMGGLIVGMSLDKKKESENLTLKYL